LSVISVDQVSKSFSGSSRKALDRVSFEVQQGVATGFVGVNGAGKTTCIKSILDFIRPDEGSITFFGGLKICNPVKARIGYLPERPYYYEFLTGEEFLRFHWNLLGKGNAGFSERSREVLERVGLEASRHSRLRSFSKGMLQRIGVAQAILNHPDLLILDEPMSGLDPDGRYMIKDIMKEQISKGVALFFSSHLLSDMEELCRDLVVIDRGRLIFQGALDNLVNQTVEQFKITYRNQNQETTEFVSASNLQFKIDLLRQDKYEISRLNPVTPTLEESFYKLRNNDVKNQESI
jgi:ABC-2 type transport system ATP-binding protein